jgi:trehalose/maltose hydrolase-like predicted phosphorylase
MSHMPRGSIGGRPVMTNSYSTQGPRFCSRQFETARFWANRAESGADGQLHIRNVEGPDEYHGHVDDNAFTNVMARWNIRRAIEVAAVLRERWPGRATDIETRIALDDSELEE